MSCREFSGTEPTGLVSNDFAISFEKFEVGVTLSASAFKPKAKKYATRRVEGTIGDIGAAQAGDMFEVKVLWIEDIENTRKNFPLAILATDDDYIVCIIDKEGYANKQIAWGMIVSPLELVEPHVNTWMQTWRSPVTVVDSTFESAIR